MSDSDVTGHDPGEETMSRVRGIARRFLLVTIVLVGALSGVLAVLFHRYLEFARTFLIGRALTLPGAWRTVAVILTPAIVFTILAAITRRFAPRTVGANLARVRMAYNTDPSLLNARSVAATFLCTPLSLGAGAPMGPEGPIVVVTSGVAAGIARLLRFPANMVRGMIPVGVAAGIAAIFNTPITGVVFALEEVFGASDRGLLGGVIVGAVAAAVVEKALLGGRALLAAPFSTWSDPRELLGFALVGVAAGVVSGVSIAAGHRLKRAWTRAMPSFELRAGLAGALIGALGLIAPSILGVGYESVSVWLHGGGSTPDTALAFAVKTIAFVIAISGGVLGGTFAPSLFMGAALGASVGHGVLALYPRAGIDPKAYSLLGMGSFFAGLLRSPIAAVLIVVELTQDYDLMVPLMLAVSLSVSISRRISRFSMVEQQMMDEGYVETEELTDPLAGVTVRSAMNRQPLSVPMNQDLIEAGRVMAGTHHHFYPVHDPGGRFAGVVTREAVENAARQGKLSQLVSDLTEQPRVVALATESLLDVVRRMQLNGADRCPVIDSVASSRVVGFLSPSDILRVRLKGVGRREAE